MLMLIQLQSTNLSLVGIVTLTYSQMLCMQFLCNGQRTAVRCFCGYFGTFP